MPRLETNQLTDLTEEEKNRFKEINQKLQGPNGLGDACKLPAEDQAFLKAKTQAWRDAKHSAPRANNRAVVQDTNHCLQRISEEVCLLDFI